MAMTKETLIRANTHILGNTNRGILFTTVNITKDAPRLSKELSDMAAGLYTWDQFRERVKKNYAVHNFKEFLDKFKPCFFYRLAPAKVIPSVPPGENQPAGPNPPSSEAANPDKAVGEQSQEPGKPLEEIPEITLSGAPIDPAAGASVARSLPQYEFSLTGGPKELGWKRVDITMDHPLLKNLSMHMWERSLMSKRTADVSVDAALWGFEPTNVERQFNKAAQDFQSSSKKLVLEMNRGLESPDTKKALAAYDQKLSEFENFVADQLRVLPTIASGLRKARKAMGAGDSKDGQDASGPYALEMGEGGEVIAVKQPLEAAIDEIDAMEGKKEQAALPSGRNEIVLLSKALKSHPLTPRKISEIALLKEEERYPALVGSMLDDLIAQKKVQPLIGNMLAVILQEPEQLAVWNVSPREVEVFHDTFLGIYSMALDQFLGVVKPMFEALMGVWALFNEWPVDVRTGQPELIVTNDELTDLWRIYNEELSLFLNSSCLQAANQYQDAISFAIVPAVEPLKDKAPADPPSGYIRGGQFTTDYFERVTKSKPKVVSRLRSEFDFLREEKAGAGGAYGRVTGAPEVMGLMTLGKQCGFSVFFSPENPVIAGRFDATDAAILQEQYAPSNVTDQDWAVSGVVCLPDFVFLPPDGILFTGSVMDGRKVGIGVPQIVVRSCFVAAGRFMANDNPKVLESIINTLSPEQRKLHRVRPLLPGLSVDLGSNPDLGRANLGQDHFLSDSILRTLLARDKSFLIYTHVRTQPPKITAPRTLKRELTRRGEQFVTIHNWRQQVHLTRILFSAYYLGGGGKWPTFDQMSALMADITNWMGWYDLNQEGYVNAFPGKLTGDLIVVEPVMEDEQLISFVIQLPFEDAVISPLEFRIA